MFGAVGGEADDLRRAHLDRVVDQRVVVGRPVQPEAVAAGRARQAARFRQAGVHRPALDARRRQVDQAGQLFLAVHAQEHAGAVEETVGFVQVRAAHRQVPCIDLVFDAQRPSQGAACQVWLSSLSTATRRAPE